MNLLRSLKPLSYANDGVIEVLKVQRIILFLVPMATGVYLRRHD
ncbi:hypothetical protein [Phocicoccus pinnipedialis]|nr:hypothetical protein [Jeotgalicoccus pinnipedialis]